jgi:hypothetical protein
MDHQVQTIPEIIAGLTEREEAALRGKLTLEEYNSVMMDSWSKGLVVIDPLAVHCGGATNVLLSELGRTVATQLRAQ